MPGACFEFAIAAALLQFNRKYLATRSISPRGLFASVKA